VSGGGRKLAARSTGSPARVGAWAWHVVPTTDSDVWPVNVSQASFTHVIRSSESSQKVGSRAFCQSSEGTNWLGRE
jgi:hypothetical protein